MASMSRAGDGLLTGGGAISSGSEGNKSGGGAWDSISWSFISNSKSSVSVTNPDVVGEVDPELDCSTAVPSMRCAIIGPGGGESSVLPTCSEASTVILAGTLEEEEGSG